MERVTMTRLGQLLVGASHDGGAARARAHTLEAANAYIRDSYLEVMETIVDKFIMQLEAQLTERRVAFTLSRS